MEDIISLLPSGLEPREDGGAILIRRIASFSISIFCCRRGGGKVIISPVSLHPPSSFISHEMREEES